MTAEVLKDFMDLTEGRFRKSGERFDVTAERLAEINATKYGQLVREVRRRKPKE